MALPSLPLSKKTDLLIFGFFFATLLVNGFWYIDWYDFFAVAHHPASVQLPQSRQFLLSSPLNFWIAAAFRLDTMAGYILIPIVEIIAALLCIGIALNKKLPLQEDQTRFVILISLTPLWLILLKWMSKTDPILVGLFALCWAFPSRWRVLWGSIMILAHREIGTMMTFFLFLMEERKDRNLLAAIFFGNLAQIIYQFDILETPPHNRFDLLFERAPRILSSFLRMPSLYVMSLFSWYWIAIILKKPLRREMQMMVAAAFLALLAEDFTRDFVLLGLPALFFHIERTVKDPDQAWLTKLAPLSVLQLQVAAMGTVYVAKNNLSDWILRSFDAGTIAPIFK